MRIEEALGEATTSLVVFGTMPILQSLGGVGGALSGVLAGVSPTVDITVLHEAESELFLASLITDHPCARKRISFVRLREQQKRLLRGFAERATQQEGAGTRIIQVNLRVYFNALLLDGTRLFIAPALPLNDLPNAYAEVKTDSAYYEHALSVIVSYCHRDGVGKYNSIATDEMLVMYDRERIPRGIFPRDAFYNTEFQRYSVWIIVFTRSGKILLHKRSPLAKDNRGQWDKSAGGHVDIGDSSSAYTAERELIEELYMPAAEYTRYMEAEVRKTINLGAWNPEKRGYERVIVDIQQFADDEWGYFQLPRTISRTSKRRLHESKAPNAEWTTVETKFMSDVFFFVAPSSFEEEDLPRLSLAAGSEHKLLLFQDLLNWVEREKGAMTATETFTDDLLYICDELRADVERFADLLEATSAQ